MKKIGSVPAETRTALSHLVHSKLFRSTEREYWTNRSEPIKLCFENILISKKSIPDLQKMNKQMQRTEIDPLSKFVYKLRQSLSLSDLQISPLEMCIITVWCE